MKLTPTLPKVSPPLYREGDLFLCSYPKMGRTWVRQFLAQYLSLTFDLGYRTDYDLIDLMSVVPAEWFLRRYPESQFIYRDKPMMPRVRCAHYIFHDLFINKPVIWLTRGIEDTLVSYYYHESRSESMGEFVCEAVGDVIQWLNGWRLGLPLTERWLHITYEDLQTDITSTFRSVIEFIGLPYKEENFRKALSRSSFDQMRKDQESTSEKRVRRGIVGSYHDELSESDIEFIQNIIQRGLLS